MLEKHCTLFLVVPLIQALGQRRSVWMHARASRCRRAALRTRRADTANNSQLGSRTGKNSRRMSHEMRCLRPMPVYHRVGSSGGWKMNVQIRDVFKSHAKLCELSDLNTGMEGGWCMRRRRAFMLGEEQRDAGHV